MSKKHIALIKGHGGKDTGAIGNGRVERDINKDVVDRVASNINRLCNNVVLYVDNNSTNVDEEITFINSIPRLDMVISFHINSGGGTGWEGFSYSENSEGMKLLKIMEKHFKLKGVISRGCKVNKNYKVIKKVKPVSIITEGYFIDNPKNLLSNDLLVEVYTKAICEYLGYNLESPNLELTQLELYKKSIQQIKDILKDL